MQPLQDDFRDPAAKDNSITNAATARSNLDAAITMRSAETELQNTIELREKKTILKHFLKGFLEGKSLAPKWRKSANKSMSQRSCSHSCTIYEIQLQKTIVLPMQPQHEATLTQPFTLRERSYSCKAQWTSIGNSSTSTTCESHLQWGNDPRVANHNGIPSATHPPAPLAIPFTLRERSYSCKSQWNSVDHTCTKNSWNPIYNAEPIRDQSAHDPTTHETVSQPSHRRGRSSRFGDALCMEKHRLSCICYLSKTHFVRDFLQNSIGNSSTSTTCNPIYSEGTILELQITMGIPSATHPPAPLAIPFTLRERSYSCKSQWNSVDRTCTKNTWNPIYNAEPIRPWSENIRPWSDHTRDRLAPVAPQR